MYKFIALLSFTIAFSNCKHHSLEQQTVEALRGKWELYETRGVDAQGNEVKVENDKGHISMFLLSPGYGSDLGLNFISNTEVSGKFSTDWLFFKQTTYIFEAPNKLTFTIGWAENEQRKAEIIKLDANELWLKRVTYFPSFGNEIRLKRVQ